MLTFAERTFCILRAKWSTVEVKGGRDMRWVGETSRGETLWNFVPHDIA
jgi:hypothetical protein